MGHLSLKLLGTPEVQHDDQALAFPTRKTLALLIHLAVAGKQSREKITALFWPESEPERGRAVLRRTLAYLRDSLGEGTSGTGAAHPHVAIEGDTLALDFTSDIALDLQHIESAARAARTVPRSTHAPTDGLPDRLAQLQAAVTAYRGDFLEGFSVNEAPEFEDWASHQREAWHQRMDLIFDRLSGWQAESGDLPGALESAVRWVAHYPLNELAYQRLMEVHLAKGNRAAAWQAYEACRETLVRELNAEPGLETKALAETIRAYSAEEIAPDPGEPPFKGLHYFDEADADLFFGREALTAKLVARIASPPTPWRDLSPRAKRVGEAPGRRVRFLAIVGASGSGKSSIVRAGLIPALRREDSSWRIHILTPTAHPLEALAVSLTRDQGSQTAALSEEMAEDPRTLYLFLERSAHLVSGATNAAHVLLVVDQFEELFTLCRDATQRKAFVDNVLGAAGEDQDKGLTVVIALRADFYAHCAQFENLREALAQHQDYIGPMTAEELRRAIEEPAKRSDWEFEPGLADLLLHDIGADGHRQPEPGALPLLSHALLETWKHRLGRTLTFSGYAISGGVRGAIATTAERVYRALSPDEQAIARRIFLRLTELGEGTGDGGLPSLDTRRRAAFNELITAPQLQPSVEAVLKTLTDARLITISEDSAEVAHEALIREWPTLREWLNENRDGLRLHHHLTGAAQAWEKLRRDPGELYRGVRLAQAAEWADAHPEELNALEREFLTASRELATREEAEREAQRQRELQAAQRLAETEKRRAEEQAHAARQLRRRAVYLTGVVALAVMAALAAICLGGQARTAADRNAALAQQNAQIASTAQVASTQAIAQQVIAIAERNRADEQRNVALDSQATAEAERSRAEHEKRLAIAREMAAAAVNNLEVDTERSVLLALEAISATYAQDGLVVLEAESALHRALSELHILHTLRGHQGVVWAVAFSPDGARLATSSFDFTVKVWDTESGEALLTLANPNGLPNGIGAAVAFSRDGKRLATGGPMAEAKVWDAATGQALFTLRQEGQATFTDTVISLAFSPDGSRLVTGQVDGRVDVWDTISQQVVLNLSGHTDQVNGLAYSADGTRIVTGSYDATARVWDAATGRQLLMVHHSPNIQRVAISPDGTRFATAGNDGVAKLWEAATGNELLTLTGHTGRVHGVSFSPDGRRLATGSLDGTARIWDVATGRELLRLSGHTGAVEDVAFSPDGAHVATGAGDWTARVWDTLPGREWLTVPGDNHALSPDGKRLAASDADGPS
jgi:WD40 repeat protein/DNA-binding SARP family transcriptional activator